MDFKLPDIGEGVHEGELVKWLVKEGDVVKVDQPLVEVMTDKATVEIPTSQAGKVTKLNAKEGDMIKVGQTIAVLDTGGAGASAEPAKKPEPQKPTPAPAAKPAGAAPAALHAAPAQQSRSAPTPSTASGGHTASPGNIMATPATRRLARDLGIDLGQVPPSGPRGRITKEDVQRFSGASAAGPQLPASSTSIARMPSAPSPSRPSHGGAAETLIPFRGIRRKVAEGMTKSRFTIPDFTYVDECDISELVEFRKEAKALAEKKGVKLTYMPFITKAVIQGLKAFPYMNSVLDEAGGNIVLKNYYNIGIAVDTDDGLIVPVLKNADQKSIIEIAGEMQTLAEKARTKKLAIDDLQGGTFTITNAGNIGGMMATPIINFPEVGIFGVHKISRRPVVRGNEIAIGDVIWLSVAVDHRVVDGAVAARFMNVVMEYLSSPKKLMLDMA